ncbi:sensor histidine kinase [Paenibacillus sp. PSB04]|uniref:sensor histidine kinase n=1 Tax=Paenibacillus sp. PSB04 TaxID=2866810 RepID=UPI0021F17F92|nr:sensor histidine kinase [Paenibacillus sp. PSB04]UYO03155.1 sensor histidine kinase [Paenibacillus sp. PSB04]
MKFVDYVKVKSWFIAFYILLMSLVTLFMYMDSDGSSGIENMVYLNMICFAGAALYLVIGYFYRRPYYQMLQQMKISKMEEVTALLPEPQHRQQAIINEWAGRLQRLHSAQLKQQLHEKKDHQDFIMSWIHEVKLPITASRLLLENGMTHNAEAVMDKLEDEIDKIDHYVEQALYYSRIDSFNRDYLITETALEPLIKASVKKYAKLFINKRIQFQMAGKPLFVHTDGKWLGYMIDQIVSNALKYTGENGRILFRCEEDAAEKRLVIEDTGIGIKAEDLPRVFDRGFTGGTGRTEAKSTGMGLYLARQMALKLSHRLTVDSAEGESTAFTLHFHKFKQE